MRFLRPLPIALAGLSLGLLVSSNSPASAHSPVGGDAFEIRRIIASNAVLSDGSPDFKEIGVQVRALGDHPAPVRVYMDVMPPGGPSNPGGCLPYGRILDDTVTLDPAGASQGTADKLANVFASFGSQAGFVEFSCTSQSTVVGQRYTLIAVVDAHGDDSGPCGEGLLITQACINALALDDDDSDVTNVRLTRSGALRVQPP